MTKKSRKALEKEQAASAAAAAEAEETRARIIQDMQEEIRLEQHNADKQVLLEVKEAMMRETQLEETWHSLQKHRNAFLEYIAAAEKEEIWIRYMTCDGLPNPGSLSEMNTFIFLWSMKDEELNMSNVARKYDVVIYLITKLDETVRFSLTRSLDYIFECTAIRQRFRDKLQEWIDAACYFLLRQIERDMTREGIKSAKYISVSKHVSCCVWALIKWPIKLKQNKERYVWRCNTSVARNIVDVDCHFTSRKPIEVHFEEMELIVKMPIDIDCYCMAIRALWVKYDHYSDRAITYFLPKLPDKYESIYKTNFLTYCRNEHDAKSKIREDQVEGRRLRLEEKKAILERMERPPEPEPTKPEKKSKQQKKQSDQMRPEPIPEPQRLPYLPTPDEIILQREEEIRKEIRKLLFRRCEKTEVNLRKYRILGGAVHIDLIYQPPQPKETERNITLTTLQIPKELKFVPFSKPYKAPPPAPDSERTPEVIEAEMKALETAMEALVLEDLVCLNSLAGGTSTAIKDILGEYMKLHFLVERMRDAGCDLFPERDACSYIKSLPIKHPVVERHVRECMALLCTAYTFSWSRWNAIRNYREIVMQFKELHGCLAKEQTNITLLVNPLQTTAVACTEVSSEFSDVPLEGDKSQFYADLYHLALRNAGVKSRLLMKSVSYKLVNTVAELLARTNVISVSS